MGLLDLLRRPDPGPEAGDFAEGDDWLDELGWLEESTVRSPAALGLVQPLLDSATRPDGFVFHGRVMWNAILKLGVAPCRIVFVDGWLDRGAPVMDVQPAANLWHHDASNPTVKAPAPALGICRDGRKAGKGVTAVRGPLCHVYIGLDGTIYVIASGRANHAGTGHRPLEERMRKGMWPAGTARDLGLQDTTGWGGTLLGYEIANNGDNPLTAEQQASILFLARVTQKAFRFSDAQAIGWDHQACTRRKVDLPEKNHAPLIARFKLTATPVPAVIPVPAPLSAPPAHVKAFVSLIEMEAQRVAAYVGMDWRVVAAQWAIETGWGTSDLFLGKGDGMKTAVPSWNVAGMVRHAEHFDGPTAIYRGGTAYSTFTLDIVKMPPTSAIHLKGQNWAAFASLHDGATGWAVRVLASPTYETFRAGLRKKPPADVQARLLGESGWSQSRYIIPGTKAGPGSNLLAIIARYPSLFQP